MSTISASTCKILQYYISLLIITCDNHVLKPVFLMNIITCAFRCWCIDEDQAHAMSKLWTLEMDKALVLFVNEFSRKLVVATSRIHPHEIAFTEAQLASEQYVCLQGMLGWHVFNIRKQ